MAAEIRGTKFIQSLSGAHEYRLTSNGLRVLIIPKDAVPVVGVMVTYHVGSRNEVPGTTGATHILEHLMFKGSKHFDPREGKGTADIIESKGALMNATTWNDRTNYYEVIGKEHLSGVLALEADRFRNLLLRPEDLLAEMVVVRNEYERWKNDPEQQLSARLWEEAFRVHPYHYPTIGTKQDIEETNVDELREFYDTFYWPKNATVTVAGDVDVETVLTEVLRVFGDIPAGDAPEYDIPKEPQQTEERTFIYERPGTVHALGIGYKIPEGTHPDSPALSTLSALLIEGKGSALNRAFVDNSYATSVHGMLSRFHDPGLFEIEITLTDDTTHETGMKVFDEEINRLASGGMSEAEFLRARTFSSAQAIYRRAAISDFINTLNESLAMGDWTDIMNFPKRIEAVSMKDLERVAGQYLTAKTRTVGHLVAI